MVEKDFNIEDEAGGAQKQLTRPFNASVTENILEIRFYWAGKGTTRIPDRGVYGPLISAISVDPSKYFVFFALLLPSAYTGVIFCVFIYSSRYGFLKYILCSHFDAQ